MRQLLFDFMKEECSNCKCCKNCSCCNSDSKTNGD